MAEKNSLLEKVQFTFSNGLVMTAVPVFVADSVLRDALKYTFIYGNDQVTILTDSGWFFALRQAGNYPGDVGVRCVEVVKERIRF
jgi:hypothetical protein